MAGSQDILIIVIMMMMMSSVFSVIAGGGLFLTLPEEGDECEGKDDNGKYVIDEDGKCVLDECDYGYSKSSSGKKCIVDEIDTDSDTDDEDDGGGGGGATYTVPTDENSKTKCYLSRYPDLRLAFGNDLNAAKSHWTTNGLSENRNKSCQMSDDEAICYLDRYPDMIAAYGEDSESGRKHYYEIGIDTDLDFACPPAKKEIECYLNRYSDLSTNLASTPFNQKYQALVHWSNHGKNENRSYVCDS